MEIENYEQLPTLATLTWYIISGFAPFTCLVIYLIHDDISNQSKKKVRSCRGTGRDGCYESLACLNCQALSPSLSLSVYPSIILPSTYLP